MNLVPSFRLMGVSLMVAACATSAALGVPAYDTITGFTAPPTQVFTNVPLHGDDTTLDANAGLTITSVELLTRHRSGSSMASFTGLLTMRLYTSVPAGSIQVPGTAFYEQTVPVTIDRGTDQLVSFAIPNVTAPSANIWTTWFFSNTNGTTATLYQDLWVRQSSAEPVVGSTAIRYGASSSLDTESPFFQFSTDDSRRYAIRIQTIPTPGVASVMFLASLAAARRRRACVC